jgi:polyhydroxybutyrate depolymerase
MQTRARIAGACVAIVLAGCGTSVPSAATAQHATPVPSMPSPQRPTPAPTATPSQRPTPTPSPVVVKAQIEAGGLSRDYTVVTPPDVAVRDSLPLLFALHGWTQTMADAESTTGFDDMALDPGAVVVYPQGYDPQGFDWSWNAGGCCKPANVDGVDDIAFIAALMDRMQADFPIDPDRIYVLGGSNGGEMAYRAACELSDRIAAVADVVGTLLIHCRPSQPVSVIDIHGADDTSIPYDGGAIGCQDLPCPAVADVMQRWRELDGCTGEPTVTETTFIVQSSWTSCDRGTAVTFIEAIGQGHTWYLAHPDDRAVTWAFFMAHPRR